MVGKFKLWIFNTFYSVAFGTKDRFRLVFFDNDLII